MATNRNGIRNLRRWVGRLAPVMCASFGLAVAAAATDTKPAQHPIKAASPGIELIFAAPASVATAQAPEVHQRTVRMLVTAYCPCKKCCGPSARGITASGKPVTYNGGQFVAADTTLLPFNSKVSIPGYAGGNAVPVIDRGSAIVGNHLDVFFPTHEEALQWGRRWVTVTIDQ